MNYDILVNKQNPLPSTYIPDNLVDVETRFNNFVDKGYKPKLVDITAIQFNNLREEASDNGYEIELSSGYRSYNYQNEILNHNIEKIGEKEAYSLVAQPGMSEHQTGLAIDFLYYRPEGIANLEKEKETEKWVHNNAHKYGFIVRYPMPKSGNLDDLHEITGYKYEPWHLRYVGVKIATEIFSKGITFEEYKEEYITI